MSSVNELQLQAIGQLVIQDLIVASSTFCNTLLNSVHHHKTQSTMDLASTAKALDQMYTVKAPTVVPAQNFSSSTSQQPMLAVS